MRKEKDLSNFSKFIEKRYILVLGEWKQEKAKYEQIQNKINNQLALIIQELSLKLTDRQIPFAKVEFVERVTNDKLRVMVFDKTNEDIEPQYINDYQESHLISIRITSGHRNVVADHKRSYANAEMIIDEEYIVCAIIDIMLDIAMFNSYSFLKGLSEVQKHEFSELKYRNYKENNYDCFFHYREILNTSPKYFSFAFSARKSKTEVYLDEYIYLWNAFTKKEFSERTNTIGSILSQLKYHKSYAQITKDGAKKDINNLFESTGSKLLLRINKVGKLNQKGRGDIANYFGVPKFHVGTLKVVDIDEYYNPRLSNYLKSSHISAFKVVVTDDNILKTKTTM